MSPIRRGACRSAGAFLLTALAALSPLLSVRAQEPPAAVRVGKSQPEVLSYAPRYAKATDLARILRELIGDRAVGKVAVAVDDRANSLLITAASAEDMEFVSKVLKALDRAGAQAPSPERQLQVFPLKYFDLNGPLPQLLQAVLAEGSGRFAIDPKRKEVIVFADRKTIQAVADVILRLDKATEQLGPEQVQVRLVWLASGPPLKDAAKPPADLNSVVYELAKIGVGEPRLVSQLIVNTRVGNPFEMQGSASLGEQPCDLQVTGTVSSQAGEEVLGAKLANPNFVVNITLNATRTGVLVGARGGPGPRQAPLCRLQTAINLRTGNSVVLGMTPTDSLTSVFVVQVLLRPEAQAGPPSKK